MISVNRPSGPSFADSLKMWKMYARGRSLQKLEKGTSLLPDFIQLAAGTAIAAFTRLYSS